MRQQSILERYLEAMEKTGDYMLAWQFQKNMMMESIYERQKREQLVCDVANEVLKHISATVDVQEIFDAIDDLDDRISRLGR